MVKILVACEESGTVTDALIDAGYDAWSCDLNPTRGLNPDKHLRTDVLSILNQGWDALIGFPECTYMANSGAKHLYIGMKKENGLNKDRVEKLHNAASFFKKLWEANIPYIALENPIMLGRAKELIGANQDQIIHPWQFGHGETKATCLWLKGFSKLVPTNVVEGREQRVWKMGPSPTRQRDRSKTYRGIADAMVSQWFPLNSQGEIHD